ncbi:zinc finger protein 711-like [Artemia franciscana]|uniref:Uncharacterized protein n=1 Tax=Artemia franciscana TaxID=6661 RepID=A0AA88I2Q1_ARTSF|nr:hypothetical protein QYM36_004024 [Artemia franciscana]
METKIQPESICKLCCSFGDASSLYSIFDTLVALSEETSPEPILPLICDFFSVKISNDHDILQCICFDCISTIQQWKTYLNRCCEAQLTLPEDLRLRKKEDNSGVDHDTQTDSNKFNSVQVQTDNCNEHLKSNYAHAVKEQEIVNIQEASAETSVSDLNKKEALRVVNRPKPLSKRTMEEKHRYLNKEAGQSVKECSVKLDRLLTENSCQTGSCVQSLDTIKTKCVSKTVDVNAVKREEVDDSEESERDSTEMTEHQKRRAGRPKKISTSIDEDIRKPEVEPIISQRSKRTPKPKRIFDPSITDRRSKLKNIVLTLPNSGTKSPQSEEYEDGQAMDDNENPKEPERSFVFVATEDGGMELVPSEVTQESKSNVQSDAENTTTISINGEYDNEVEKVKIVKRRKVTAKEIPRGRTPRSGRLSDFPWMGHEFTMEFLESAIERDLDPDERAHLEDLIRRKRFRELWIQCFIGSIKGSIPLKRRACPECGEVIQSEIKAYEKHCKSHNVTPEFVCEVCGLDISSADDYYDHWEDHLSHYACRGCKIYFPTREERDAHKLSSDHIARQSSKRHGETPKRGISSARRKDIISPPPKRRLSKIKIETKKYIAEGMQVECPVCGLEFPSKGDLKDHTTLKHAKKGKVGGEEAFVPSILKSNRKLSSGINILKVVEDLEKINNYEVLNGQETLSDEEEESGGHSMCPVCHESFGNLRKLSLHLAEDHGRSKDLLYCEFCDVMFSSESDAKKHRKAHYTQSEFCKLCNQWFTTKKKLEKHMLSHLGEEEIYSCYLCDKSFAREEQLRSHEDLMHSDQARFECALCGEKFTKRKDCLVHIAEHGEFDNHAQFVQQISIIEEGLEDSNMDSDLFFGDDDEEYIFEDTN